MTTRMKSELDVTPGYKLLVVDDDLVQRTIIGRIGAQIGYVTHAAASVEEATDLITSHVFDCVTLDLSLGDQSGTRLLDLIASSGTHGVIVISGCDDRLLNAAAQLVRTVGLAAYQMPKPLNLSELRRLLSVCMTEVPSSSRAPRVAQCVDRDAVAAAIDRNEIVPWFQPKISLESGAIVGCEALARWLDPARGPIPPDVFIPLAEASGLMPALTRSLLASATTAMRELTEMDPAFTVAVNVSASLLSDRQIATWVDESLTKSGLSASNLVLEVTESVAMSDVARAVDVLLGFRVKGIGLSIDDFGTGYSSIAALARMPFNELKIDRQFVHESESNSDMMQVVQASVDLGHRLGMKVVAEGIETPRMLARMRRAGCDIGQGIAFLPAVEPVRFTEYARRFARTGVGLQFDERISLAG